MLTMADRMRRRLVDTAHQTFGPEGALEMQRKLAADANDQMRAALSRVRPKTTG